MSQSKDKILDARSLWVPVSVVIAMGAALVIAGMWIQQTNDNRTQTQDMEDKLDALISQQATMQGSLNALMEMQATLSKTAAEVGSLDSRMNAFETRIQTQDAWIQNTRQKLLEHGFRPPEYRSGDYKPGPPG